MHIISSLEIWLTFYIQDYLFFCCSCHGGESKHGWGGRWCTLGILMDYNWRMIVKMNSFEGLSSSIGLALSVTANWGWVVSLYIRSEAGKMSLFLILSGSRHLRVTVNVIWKVFGQKNYIWIFSLLEYLLNVSEFFFLVML